MLTRALRMTFWVLWDHLGKMIAANLCCAIGFLAPLGIAHACMVSGTFGRAAVVVFVGCLLAAGIMPPIMMCGVLCMARELIETRDGSLRTFALGIRRFARRAALIGVTYGMAAVCLFAGAWFYAVRWAEQMPLLGYALSISALWLLFLLGMTAQVALPALVYRNTSVTGAVKTAALLTLDNPLFIVGLMLCTTAALALWVMPPVLIFFSFAPVAVLQACAYEILARRYAFIRARTEHGETASRKMAIDYGDADDEYLNRGIRELLFPWKE